MRFQRFSRASHALLALSLSWPVLTRAQGGTRAAQDSALIGLWGAEPRLGPQVRGRLVLERGGTHWSLRVGGFEAAAPIMGDSVIFALPGGQGMLRIWQTERGVDAYWIQPAGLGQAFATPVPLRAAGSRRWAGTVTPIEETFPLYLSIQPGPDGSLHGVFRNPAQNWPGRTPYYRVARDGDVISFTNPRTGAVQWRQPYDANQPSISFDFGVPIVLTRRTAAQAVGFVARSAGLPRYQYRIPVDLSDGWQVQSAAQLHVDTTALASIIDELARIDPLDDAPPRVHAVLMARSERLLVEEYFRGLGPDVPHDLRSASKTMTSIMVGAAIARGATLSGTTALPRSPITLAHLLSHSSGKACDDDVDDSPGNEDRMQSQHEQPDWYAFFDALPTQRPPGEAYAYCSAGINRVGALLRDATSLWLPRFFDRALARPMQFGAYGINLMPTGDAYFGGGMHLLPRDFLKFGPLILNHGRWQDRRLVSAAWIRESIAHHTNRPDGSDDGLGWHRHVLQVGNRRLQTIEASGNGGQFLLLVPELQLSIVVTAGNYGQYEVWQRIRTDLMPRLIAAVR